MEPCIPSANSSLEMRLNPTTLKLSSVEKPSISNSTSIKGNKPTASDNDNSDRSFNLHQQHQQHQQSRLQQNSINEKISSEFEKNIFIASSNKHPITTIERTDQVFEVLGLLGSGTSGIVSKMRHKSSNTVCAVKQMRRSGNEEENKRIYMDLQVLLKCKCDYIVQCYGYFIEDVEVWICMESMKTCFAKLMCSYKKPLPENFLGAVAVAVLKALGYLKEYHMIIHRDVKPSNILINEIGEIKLCDFGISGRLIDSRARTTVGCLRYMAPERVDPDLSCTYDVRSDVWSLGLTLIELATCKYPYADCNTDFAIMQKVIFNEPPTLPSNMEFSNECRSFVSACLIKDFKSRPKYNKLIEHEFIKKHMDTKVSLEELGLNHSDF